MGNNRSCQKERLAERDNIAKLSLNFDQDHPGPIVAGSRVPVINGFLDIKSFSRNQSDCWIGEPLWFRNHLNYSTGSVVRIIKTK